MDWINKDRWTADSAIMEQYLKKNFTSEEISKIKEAESKKKSFCYFKDYDAYYTDFWQYFNIDLATSDIDWFRFNWFLNSLIDKEDSAIRKRINYRNYKPSKHDDSAYKKTMNDKKAMYSLDELNGSNANLYETMKGGK